MLKHYLIIALRTIKKQKLFAIINSVHGNPVEAFPHE